MRNGAPAAIIAAVPLLVLGLAVLGFGYSEGVFTGSASPLAQPAGANCPVTGDNAYGEPFKKFGGGKGNGNGNGNWGNNNGNGNSGSFNGNGNVGDNHGNHASGDCYGNGPLPWWFPTTGASETTDS